MSNTKVYLSNGKWVDSLSVEYPHCQAKVGEVCRAPSGKKKTYHPAGHQLRINAAIKSTKEHEGDENSPVQPSTT